jgi:hypothetical protein
MIQVNIHPLAVAMALAINDEIRARGDQDFTLPEILESVQAAHPVLDITEAHEVIKVLQIFKQAMGADPSMAYMTGVLAVDGLLVVKGTSVPINQIRFSTDPKGIIAGMAADVGIPIAQAWPAITEELRARKAKEK